LASGSGFGFGLWTLEICTFTSGFVIPTSRAAATEESAVGLQHRYCRPATDSSILAARVVGM